MELGVVPHAMATVVGDLAYLSKGVGPSCHSSGTLGQPVEGLQGEMFLRQHGGGLRDQQRLGERSPADEAATNIVLFLCGTRGHSRGQTCPRRGQYTGGCSLTQQNVTVSLSPPTSPPSTNSHTPSSTATSARPGPPVDLRSLDSYLGDCVAPSTRASYASAQRRYLAFCAGLPDCQPFPLTEEMLPGGPAAEAPYNQGLSVRVEIRTDTPQSWRPTHAGDAKAGICPHWH